MNLIKKKGSESTPSGKGVNSLCLTSMHLLGRAREREGEKGSVALHLSPNFT